MQIKGVLDQMQEKFGGVHAVVQCAGIATASRVLGKRGVHSLADFEKVRLKYPNLRHDDTRAQPSICNVSCRHGCSCI